MTKNKSMEVQEQEIVEQDTERTRECRCFIPRTDIYEHNETIVLVLDMPGIHENAIEITLEKDILEVKGFSQVEEYQGMSLVKAEYEPGDYERKFRVSNSVNREKIDATYNDGVLRVTLPKADIAKTKKISVKSS